MSYRPFEINRFVGLDLTGNLSEGGALCSLDVDPMGDVLYSRPGIYTENTPTDGPFSRLYGWDSAGIGAASSASVLMYYREATARMVALHSNGVSYVDAVQIANPQFYGFGAPGQSRIYYCRGVTVASGYYDTAANTFNAVAAMPLSETISGLSISNRLAVGNIPTYNSRVNFSDPGDPGTWGANNYISITPGDGDDIKSLVAWRDKLFIFKSKKFALVYGESTGADGNPVFNNTVVEGKGCVKMRLACAGPDGVYFVAADGIYVTTGGAATCISDLIAPLFDIDGVNPAAEDRYTLAKIPIGVRVAPDQTNSCITWHDDPATGGGLYFSTVFSDGVRRMLVWRPNFGWTIYSWTVTGMTSWGGSPNTPGKLLFLGVDAATDYIGSARAAGSAADTRGTPFYRTPFLPLGAPGRSETMREIVAHGEGTATIATDVDFGTGYTSSEALTAMPGRVRTSNRGERMSFEVSALVGTPQYGGSTNVGSIYRLIANLRGERAASIGQL